VIDFDWIARNLDTIAGFLTEHVVLTVVPLVAGMAIAFPLALLALRKPRLYGPLLAVTGVMFTIPSLALFVLLIPFTGLARTTSYIGLTIYTLLILLRNTVEGLRGVPRDVREAAEAMGYSRLRQLLTVEFPLALPVIVAGLRIAAVTTIGLVAVTALIGQGGFGQLMLLGVNRFFPTPIIVGIVGSVVLAVIADVGLLGVQRLASPWTRNTP
jgi:osmoprotectant transport system permease protein